MTRCFVVDIWQEQGELFGVGGGGGTLKVSLLIGFSLPVLSYSTHLLPERTNKQLSNLLEFGLYSFCF